MGGSYSERGAHQRCDQRRDHADASSEAGGGEGHDRTENTDSDKPPFPRGIVENLAGLGRDEGRQRRAAEKAA
jgi:hypothetical protein